MKRVVLAVLAAMAVLLVAVEAPRLFDDHPLPPVARTAPPPPAAAPAAAPSSGAEVVAAAPASAASGPVTTAERVEEVQENPDAESGLERIIPRRSIAREQGLDKTADPLRLGSSAAVVVEPASKQVLFRKNESAVLPMASITKLMTALVIAEAHVPMDEVIAITDDDVDQERHSRSRLRVGTTLARSEALHLALMSSENRAAHALGRTYPGGLAKFIPAMNAKARELGMTQTTYVDPTGLSNQNRSTAADLATLVQAASKEPLLREYSTDPQHRTMVGTRTLMYNNSNRLVKNRAWDIELQKTGYIIEAGHCVAMLTKVAGRDVVMVLLDANSNGARNADAERLRRWLGGAAESAVAKGDDAQTVHAGARKAVPGRKTAAAAPTRAERKVAERSRAAQADKASARGDRRVRKSFANHTGASKDGEAKVAAGADDGKS